MHCNAVCNAQLTNVKKYNAVCNIHMWQIFLTTTLQTAMQLFATCTCGKILAPLAFTPDGGFSACFTTLPKSSACLQTTTLQTEMQLAHVAKFPLHLHQTVSLACFTILPNLSPCVQAQHVPYPDYVQTVVKY